jgi:hypothetical protein
LTIDKSILALAGVRKLVEAGQFSVDATSDPPLLKVATVSWEGFWKRPAMPGNTALVAFGATDGLDASIVPAELCFALKYLAYEADSSDDDLLADSNDPKRPPTT